MARHGSDVLVKRNSKLEAFLKRNLDEDTFERIRVHEPCVVCSKKEDKAFKFAIISDEWIYLTENPPKKVSEEVHLGNIVSIKLVNDFPEFLSGEERQNTQHILIKYMSREPPKGKAKKQAAIADKTNAQLGTGNLTYRSSLSARSGKSPWLERKTQSLKEMATTKHSDIPPRRRCSMDADMLRDALEKDASSDTDSKKKRKKKNKKIANGDREDNADTVSVSSQGRKLPPRHLPERNGRSLVTAQPGELRLALEKLDEQDDGEDGNTTIRTSRLNNNNNDLSKSDSRLSFLRRTTILEESSPPDGDDTWYPEELHLYILSLTSPLLVLTRAAWNNYLIRETLVQDSDYYERTLGFLEPKSTASEKFSLLFAHLKTDLLKENVTLEEMFNLINELKAAAERNFAVKKLFWRSPDMLLFFIKQIQTYLAVSPTKRFAEDEEDKEERADELEFVILLLETLAHMFRETETLPSRMSCLRSGQGRAATDLLQLLVAQPHLLDVELPKPQITSNKNISKQRDWHSDADVELLSLAEELTVVTTTVLSELILIAQQANMTDSGGGKQLNLCWLVSVLDEQSNTESYLEQVVGMALKLINPTNREELQPVEAVTLFHQFSLLSTMIEYSHTSAAFIRDNFYEEFKYFVQGHVILSKLPEHFPIADTTIKLIEKVMSSVLGKSVSLALNNALS